MRIQKIAEGPTEIGDTTVNMFSYRLSQGITADTWQWKKNGEWTVRVKFPSGSMRFFERKTKHKILKSLHDDYMA